jgi:hypothetical protein
MYAQQIAVLLPGASADMGVVEELLVGIQDKAEEILVAADLPSAQPLLNEFKSMGEQLVNDAAPTFYASALGAVSYSISPSP